MLYFVRYLSPYIFYISYGNLYYIQYKHLNNQYKRKVSTPDINNYRPTVYYIISANTMDNIMRNENNVAVCQIFDHEATRDNHLKGKCDLFRQ